MDERNLPIKGISSLLRPILGLGRGLLAFAGLEEGRLHPRAAVLGALIAALALGAFLVRGGEQARAVFPAGTTVVTDQEVIAPSGLSGADAGSIPEGTPAQATTIQYTVTVTIPAGPSSGNNASLTVDLDNGLSNVRVTGLTGDFVGATCTVAAGNVVTCLVGGDTDLDPGTHTVTILADVGDLPLGTVISTATTTLSDANGACGAPTCTYSGGAGDGNYFVDVTVDPEDEVNLVGVDEVFTFSIRVRDPDDPLPGDTVDVIVCDSDATPLDNTLTCTLGDVVITGPLQLVSFSVIDSDLSDLVGMVQVTVRPTGPGAGTVALRLDRIMGTDTNPVRADFPSPVARKVGITGAGATLYADPDPDHWNVIGSDHLICVTPPDGWAWDGDEQVTILSISTQFGANWTQTSPAELTEDGDLCVTATSTMPGEWTGATVEVFDPDLGATISASGTFVKEWSNLVDSAIILLPLRWPPDFDEPSEWNDVDRQHAHSVENQVVNWREGVPLRVVEISHGEHQTLGGPVHVPVDHAVVDVDWISPRNCIDRVLVNGAEATNDPATQGRPDVDGETSAALGFQHGAALITVVPRDNCEEQTTIIITEDYPRDVSSLFQKVVQVFTINWITIEAAKQPLIAKAGEKVILEILDPGTVQGADEGAAVAVCMDRWVATFWRIVWVLEQGPTGALLPHEFGEYVAVEGVLVEQWPNDAVWISPGFDGEIGTDDDVWRCVWDVEVHSEDPGQVDVMAQIFDGEDNLVEERPFVIWFVKLYSVSTTFVPGSLVEVDADGNVVGKGFDYDGDGLVEPVESNRSGLRQQWRPEPAVFGDHRGSLPAGDSRFETRNVSDHALVRVTVKDYIYLANPSSRGDVCLDMDGDGNGTSGSAPGPYPTTVHQGCPDREDEAIAGGYWVLPDDFELLAGFLPNLMRPSWDDLFGPDDPDPAGVFPVVGPGLVGPKRTVARDMFGLAFYCYNEDWASPDPDVDLPDCSSTPNTTDEGAAVTFRAIYPNAFAYAFLVNIWDVQMPLEKVTLAIRERDEAPGFHSGLLIGVDKDVVYWSGKNPYYQVNIPANDDIPVVDAGGGYDWNSSVSGPHQFWHVLNWLRPGRLAQLYTDNRGQAMALVLGDWDLTFAECSPNPITGAPECSRGDVVGRTAVVATVDYPYHRGKHRDMRAAPAIETWQWGGYKSGVDAGDPDLPERLRSPEIVPTDNPSFKYLVVHLKDRDGACDNLWPDQIDPLPGRNGVRGEPITFRIDSPQGRIVDAALDGVISADGKTAADVRTGRVFSANDPTRDDFDAAGERHFTPFEEGECQAWILIQNSTTEPTNVSIEYNDPEGDIVIDVLVPGAGTERIWGDVDCDSDVDAVDALKVLRYVVGLSVVQTEPCPDIGSTVTVDTAQFRWGDVDGDGDVDAVDALKILRHVVGLSVVQEPGTPPIGSRVRVS